MAIVEELLRAEKSGAISFGNHTLTEKSKKEQALTAGDVYKVKTYNEITKLEKNGMFLYESVPGTSVVDFVEAADEISFKVEGAQDAQLTVGMKDDTEYEVYVNGAGIGKMRTGLGGKLSLSVELEAAGEISVRIVEA